LAIGNEKRGMSRFVSLLRIFGLEDRLVTENTPEISGIIKTPIDFEKVNSILNTEKTLAMKFLNDALK
jgi:hypothetical protein